MNYGAIQEAEAEFRSDDASALKTTGEASKVTQGQRKAGTEKYKIQIQLSERAKDRLFDLVDRTDADSAAQVVREALRVYDVLIEELDEKGSELFLKAGTNGDVIRLRLF